MREFCLVPACDLKQDRQVSSMLNWLHSNLQHAVTSYPGAAGQVDQSSREWVHTSARDLWDTPQYVLSLGHLWMALSLRSWWMHPFSPLPYSELPSSCSSCRL